MVQKTSWTAGSGWAGKEMTHLMQPEVQAVCVNKSRSAPLHCTGDTVK